MYELVIINRQFKPFLGKIKIGFSHQLALSIVNAAVSTIMLCKLYSKDNPTALK